MNIAIIGKSKGLPHFTKKIQNSDLRISQDDVNNHPVHTAPQYLPQLCLFSSKDQPVGCGLLLQGNDKYYFCNNPIESYIGKILLGEAFDPNGRCYKDYLNQTHLQLETRHNYIQYMFPTDIPSQYVDAPTISADDAYILGKNKTVRENLRLATEVMIEFFTNKKIWTKNDHNFKRISRILRCLRIFGLDDEADHFYETIIPVVKSIVDDKTKTYWIKNNQKVERNLL